MLAVVAIQDALVLSDTYPTNRVIAFFMRHPSFVKLLAQYKSPAFRQALNQRCIYDFVQDTCLLLSVQMRSCKT